LGVYKTPSSQKTNTIINSNKKEGLSSIGIHKKHLWAALFFGFVFSIISLMLYRGLLPGWLFGGLIGGLVGGAVDEAKSKNALCAYLVLFAVVVAHFVIPQIFELTLFWAVINGLVALPVITIAMTFTIVVVKKQGLASIGFRKDRLWPGLRFGLLIALVYLGFGIVPGLMSGLEFNSLGTLASSLERKSCAF